MIIMLIWNKVQNMHLKEYLEKNNLTQSGFIERVRDVKGVKIPQGTLSKWITGVRIPRKDEVILIYEVTEAVVQPNDFYGVTNEH